MSAAARRRELGRWAILSPTEAASLLPGRESDNLKWLREQHLIRVRPGTDREEVRWGEVYDRYDEVTSTPVPEHRPSPANLPVPASKRRRG
jgi:hypothetical protein